MSAKLLDSFDGVDLGGSSPSRKARKAKPAKDKAIKPRTSGGSLKVWAYSGVGATLTLSAWLNGIAFSLHAPSPAAGWALGIAIPLLVLVFSRVAALLWLSGQRAAAIAGALACGSILLLSVQHLAQAIAILTGEHVALAALMALAIDAGLVVCEIATVRKS